MDISSASGILNKLICSLTEAEIKNDRQLIRIAKLSGKVTPLKGSFAKSCHWFCNRRDIKSVALEIHLLEFLVAFFNIYFSYAQWFSIDRLELVRARAIFKDTVCWVTASCHPIDLYGDLLIAPPCYKPICCHFKRNNTVFMAAATTWSNTSSTASGCFSVWLLCQEVERF